MFNAPVVFSLKSHPDIIVNVHFQIIVVCND
jgi:hypothetical protein